MSTESLASLVPGLADGYRERYLARGYSCETCGSPATRGRWADHPDGRLAELSLCDTCDAPEPWVEA